MQYVFAYEVFLNISSLFDRSLVAVMPYELWITQSSFLVFSGEDLPCNALWRKHQFKKKIPTDWKHFCVHHWISIQDEVQV